LSSDLVQNFILRLEGYFKRLKDWGGVGMGVHHFKIYITASFGSNVREDP
jgi:hypothetical protein